MPRPPDLERITFHAVASGLTSLIPVPFLDDLALRRVRERMVRSLLEEQGLAAPDAAVALLAGSHVGPTPRQRAVGYLRALALWPVRRIFRKAFLALWVKDIVDVASASLHLGYLVQHALARGDLDAQALQGDGPARVHDAIEAACREADPRPINRLLRQLLAGSRLVLAGGLRALRQGLRIGPREPRPGEQAEVASLASRLRAALGGERAYFATLEAHYARHLAAPGTRR